MGRIGPRSLVQETQPADADREDAWAFVWKALRHLSAGGLTAFLLPAMGFLHNIADTSLAARKHLIRTSRILRIINFADLRFQLFDSAIRPTALFLFAPGRDADTDYRFEYWAPKADLNLQIKRTITLSSADRVVMNSATAESDVWRSSIASGCGSLMPNCSPICRGFPISARS